MAKDRLSTTKKTEAADPFGLTVLQRAFVEAFTTGATSGNGIKSATKAGYSAKTAGQISCALLKLSQIQNAIDAAFRIEVSGTLTAQALGVIRKILADENAPLRLRGDMAAKVVEFSGIVERVKLEKARETGLDGQGQAPKRLAEYTRQELETLVRNGAELLQAAAALPAKPDIEGSLTLSPDNSPTKPDKPLASLMVARG